MLIIIGLINRLFMLRGSWLKAHGGGAWARAWGRLAGYGDLVIDALVEWRIDEFPNDSPNR